MILIVKDNIDEKTTMMILIVKDNSDDSYCKRQQ